MVCIKGKWERIVCKDGIIMREPFHAPYWLCDDNEWKFVCRKDSDEWDPPTYTEEEVKVNCP